MQIAKQNPVVLEDRTNRSILIVDDDPALLQLLGRWLNGRGVEILLASSGIEALTILSERDGDVSVIVADHYMPGMTGIQLLGAVGNRYPLVRRILYTGFADSELVLSAHVSIRVLTKSMDAGLVRDAILKEVWR